MRQSGYRALVPPDPPAQVLNLLKLRLWKAEPLAAGRFLLEQARQIRTELRGQLPGLPNLSSPARRFEADAILVWEAIPEIACRLMKQDGAVALISREERQMVPCDHFSDADLRAWTGELLRPERFAAAARILQDHPEDCPRTGIRPFASEIFGTQFDLGNAVEIASAKLTEVDLSRTPVDAMSRRMALLGEAVAPGQGWRSWSPRLNGALLARGREPLELPLWLPGEREAQKERRAQATIVEALGPDAAMPAP